MTLYVNYFNDLIDRYQGKGTIYPIYIPLKVYMIILKEMKNDKLTEEYLTIKKIKTYLKTHDLYGYSKHTLFIRSEIVGKERSRFQHALIEILQDKFKTVKRSYEKLIQSDSKNYISHSYIFYKIFQMFGENRYIETYQLLKSKSKFQKMDVIWEKICGDVGWVFYPSENVIE